MFDLDSVLEAKTRPVKWHEETLAVPAPSASDSARYNVLSSAWARTDDDAESERIVAEIVALVGSWLPEGYEATGLPLETVLALAAYLLGWDEVEEGNAPTESPEA